jgi:hypothetical protein
VGDERYLNDSVKANASEIGAGRSLIEWCESREYDLSENPEALR